MRRITLGLVAGTLAVVPMAAATVTLAGPTSQVKDGSPHQFTLSGSVAGGIVAADFGQPLTFVLTEHDGAKEPAFEDIILTGLVGGDLTASTCVLPSGSAINPDVVVGAPRALAAAGLDGLSFCEPGELHRGDIASMVANVTVNGSSDHIAASACLLNENTGEVGACHTILVSRE